MDFAKLFSTLAASSDDDGVPRTQKFPGRKPKFVKFIANDVGEGMPDAFFEGGWMQCSRIS